VQTDELEHYFILTLKTYYARMQMDEAVTLSVTLVQRLT
jgi:hypothetical protein